MSFPWSDLAAVLGATAAVAVLAWFEGRLALRHRGPRAALVVVSRVLLVAWLLLVLALTLTPGAPGLSGVNLVPGDGIAIQLDNGWLGVANLVGNLVLLFPLGLLAGPALGWRLGRVFWAGMALSVGIELAQHHLGRTSDIDDVLLNGVGLGLGALNGAVARLALHGPARSRPSALSPRQRDLLCWTEPGSQPLGGGDRRRTAA